MIMQSFCSFYTGVGVSDVRYNHSLLFVCLMNHRLYFHKVHWNEWARYIINAVFIVNYLAANVGNYRWQRTGTDACLLLFFMKVDV